MRHEHVQRLGRVLSVHGELRRRRRAVAHADIAIVVVHRLDRDAALRLHSVPDAGADTGSDGFPDAGADVKPDGGADGVANGSADARADARTNAIADHGADARAECSTDTVADAVSNAGADAGSRGL